MKVYKIINVSGSEEWNETAYDNCNDLIDSLWRIIYDDIENDIYMIHSEEINDEEYIQKLKINT